MTGRGHPASTVTIPEPRGEQPAVPATDEESSLREQLSRIERQQARMEGKIDQAFAGQELRLAAHDKLLGEHADRLRAVETAIAVLQKITPDRDSVVRLDDRSQRSTAQQALRSSNLWLVLGPVLAVVLTLIASRVWP